MTLPLEAPKDWYPGTAISLGEMMRIFESHYLCMVTRNLERLSSMLNEPSVRGQPPDESTKDAIRETIRDLRGNLESLELPVAVKQLDRITVSLGANVPVTMGNLAHATTELSARMEDELETSLVLQIPRERSPYFEKTDGFGSGVGTRFPDVAFDLEEAHTCYALGRYTAAIYHTMRVLEVGLQELAADLRVSVPDSKNWQVLLDNCRTAIKALPRSTGDEKKQLGQRQATVAHLQSVKDAWRNDTMHPRAQYTEPQARDILTNAKALMASLAEFL